MIPHSGKLKVSTPSDREVLMSRDFEAPRRLVWDAWTKPELLKKWLYGLEGWSLAVCDMDLRPGGAFRWVWRKADGTQQMGLRGVYREVVHPERIVHTEIFDEDWTGGETLVTLVLTERAGRTSAAMTVLYASREARDGALKTGMEEGMGLGYDRLEKLLAAMQRDSGKGGER